MKMLKKEAEQRQAVEMLCTDMLVPREHLLRKIDAAVNFARIYDLVVDLYCEDNGRPSCCLLYTSVLQEGREKAWLLKVALNRCRDLWRGAWVKRVILGSPAFELIPAPDEIDKLADQQEIMGAIHQLPASFREVILLHYYQGYGITEIAEMMDLPEGTISSRLSQMCIRDRSSCS